MQTAVVWSCFPFIRSSQNHLARHSEREKKTRRTKEEMGRQHYGMDKPGVQQVPEGSGEHGKMEKNGCRVICGAPMTLAVKGLMMIMIMMSLTRLKPVWNDRSISFSSKIWLMHPLVTSIFLHACESWTLTAELQRRIQASKSGANVRYNASHTKTMLPTRKSVPRSSRQ